MREPVLRVSHRLLAVGAAVVLLLVVMVALSITGVVARVVDPTAVAAAPILAVQQAAAERDVERAYEQATAQVRKVRALNLAISAQQADVIGNKALTDLAALRRSAFVAIGQLLSMSSAEAETYAASTELRFNQQPVTGQPSPSPVLLAPRLYTIVSKMSEVSTQLSDKATTDLTAPAPTGTPTAAPAATPTPSRSPSATPSPSSSR